MSKNVDINIWPQRYGSSHHGMVATQHNEATNAGVEMLAEGGNAIGAAVAAAFALGVCEPTASGLGGQTMMMIHMSDPRRTLFVDGSSRAPSRAVLEKVPRNKSRLHGYRATTVPSTPAVLGYTLKQYGTLPLHRVMEPAIRIAENGYAVSSLQHFLQNREEKIGQKGMPRNFSYWRAIGLIPWDIYSNSRSWPRP